MGLLGQLDEVHKSWMAEAEELRQENVRLREQIQTMEQTTTPCKGLDDETVDTMCTTSPPHPLQQASSEDTESTNAAKEFASGFKLRQEWGAMHPDDPSHLKQFRNNIKISISNLDDSPRLEIDDGGGGSIWHQFICFPTSRWRMFWDIIGGVFIFYDLISIPLQLAFSVPETILMKVLSWLTLIYWTMNVFASLCVGYVHDGVAIMEPHRILVNYLKTWFLIDMVVILPDWTFVIVAAVQGDGQAMKQGSGVKLLRVLRLVRMVRLLRLVRLRKLVQSVNDLIDSEYVSIVANIVKMIACLLAINHFIACLWFIMSKNLNRDDSWVRKEGFEHQPWEYQYATSFHWSITQFTPASMSVQPQNLSERAFAIAVVVIALVVFSYLVGRIVSSISQLMGMKEDFHKQFWSLRRYLRQNNVETTLSIRIHKYLEHAWHQKKQKVSATDIKLITLLSEQLYNELQCALTLPHMRVHPLLHHLDVESSVTTQRLAKSAISGHALARDDWSFIAGEKATSVCFIVAGRLEYIRLDSQNQVNEIVDTEDWIAEPVLWTESWFHRGGLIAKDECELLLLEATKFIESVNLNPLAVYFVTGYARKFMAWLNSEPIDLLSDISQGELISDRVRGFIPASPEGAVRVRGSSLRNKLSGKS